MYSIKVALRHIGQLGPFKSADLASLLSLLALPARRGRVTQVDGTRLMAHNPPAGAAPVRNAMELWAEGDSESNSEPANCAHGVMIS